MKQIAAPFPLFVDRAGDPLEAGYVYIGAVNQNPETSPVAVYWDEAGTQPAAQPLRTSGGLIVNGVTPARVYVATDDFSMTVKTRAHVLVINVLSVLSSSTLRQQLADDSQGAGLVAYSPLVTYPAGTIGAALKRSVNVKDFGAVGDGITDDTSAIQDAIDAGNGGIVYFPQGFYIVSSSLNVPSRTSIVFETRGVLGTPPSGIKQNYFGDYVGGTLIKYTGSGGCFDLIGDGTAQGNVEFCEFHNVSIWGAPLSVTTNFGLYRPKESDSCGWVVQNGSGHRWVNCWVSSLGFAGWRLGIQGMYKGAAYQAHKSGAGRPTNCKIVNCYSSNVFGYGLVILGEQIDVVGFESDSFTINSSTYSGFQCPVSTLYETGAAWIANSVNVRFASCHFEGHSGRSSGVKVLRYQVDASSAIPQQTRFINSMFYGGIYGLQIGREGDGFPLGTQVIGCAVNAINNGSSPPVAGIWNVGLQTIIESNTFTGGDEVRALYAGGTDGVVSSNIFKGCNLPITSAYRDVITNNTSTATVGSYAVVASTAEPPRVIDNVFDKDVDFGTSAIFSSTRITDFRSGIRTNSASAAGGVIALNHVGAVSATTTGTVICRINTSTAASNLPFSLKLKAQVQHSSQKFGEATIAGVSIAGGSPQINVQALGVSFGYAAASDLIGLVLGVGYVDVQLKSGTGVTSTMYFEATLLGHTSVTYDPA